MGSMVETFPNRTSGMYKAHTTWAQLFVSVLLRAPSRLGHNSQRCNFKITFFTFKKSNFIIYQLTTRATLSWDSHLRQNHGPVGT
jgi:hypothetical protein